MNIEIRRVRQKIDRVVSMLDLVRIVYIPLGFLLDPRSGSIAINDSPKLVILHGFVIA